MGKKSKRKYVSVSKICLTYNTYIDKILIKIWVKGGDSVINGEKVRTHRLERGLSQAELAKTIGISQTQLSRIEKGQGDTTTEILVCIKNALGLHDVKELLEEANPQIPRKVARKRVPRGSGGRQAQSLRL